VFQTRIHPERKDWVWWSGGFVFLTNPSKGEREREIERERERERERNNQLVGQAGRQTGRQDGAGAH
jgi:hypothetical protein